MNTLATLSTPVAPIDVPRMQRSVEHAHASAQRAATLTQQLLAFARKQRLDGRSVNLNDTVHGMQDLVERTLGDEVEVQHVLQPDLWNSRLDPSQAEVAFLVEEGRFLRVAASVGPLEPTVGMLIPVDDSLLGWAVTSGEPALSDRLDDDPRSWKAPVLPVALTTAAVVPLRSAGVVIRCPTLRTNSKERPGSVKLEPLGD